MTVDFVSGDESMASIPWVLTSLVEGVIDKKQWVAFLADLDQDAVS